MNRKTKQQLMDIIDDFREQDPPEDGRGWTEHLADFLLSQGITVSPSEEKSTVMHAIYNTVCPGEEDFGSCPARKDGHCFAIQKLEICQANALAQHLIDSGIVPVVKCQDCEYSKETKKSKEIGSLKCELHNIYVEDNDYCSSGEWRSNES